MVEGRKGGRPRGIARGIVLRWLPGFDEDTGGEGEYISGGEGEGKQREKG